MKKQVKEYVLDRMIPIGEITEATLSPFVDNFVALKCPMTFWDVVIETEFKTELVAWLLTRGSLTASGITFAATYVAHSHALAREASPLIAEHLNCTASSTTRRRSPRTRSSSSRIRCSRWQSSRRTRSRLPMVLHREAVRSMA